MISAIMQPTYLPWIGYFDLIDSVDSFVFFDDAQVLKRSWGVRNRILTQNGETFLTVPLVGHSQNGDCTFANTADNFVEVGSTVSEGQTICIIEAMKVMNEIKAEQSGTITEIAVEDGNPVQFGDVLFRIK